MGNQGNIESSGLIDQAVLSREMLGSMKFEEPEYCKDIVRLDTTKKFRLLSMSEIEIEQQKSIL